MEPSQDNTLTHRVIGYTMAVHSHLGPGLLESIYEACLCHEFARAGLAYTRQQPLPVKYKGHDIDCQFRLDLVVEQNLLLEIKAVHQIHSIHEAQLLTYLRVSGLKLGLLLNFNEFRLRDGIGRRRI